MMRRWAALLSLSLAASTVQAGLFNDDEARRQIGELKTEWAQGKTAQDSQLQVLQTDVQSQHERLQRVEQMLKSGGLIEMMNQVEQLKAELAKVRGELEVVNHQLDTAQKRQKDLYVDLDGRLRQLEQAPAAAAASNAGSSTVAVVDANATRTPAAGEASTVKTSAGVNHDEDGLAYQAALNVYRVGNYRQAIEAFQAFLKRYPESELVPNAMYWLGFSHAAEKDCKTAILLQAKLVQLYPQNAKAPDALLNQASCMVELKDLPGSRRTLQDLVQRYPNSAAAEQARRMLQNR